MTLLAGFNAQEYALLAADTRITYKIPIFGDKSRDGDHKIIHCHLGLFTGSGYSEAIDAVKNKLLSTAINHTDDLNNIINTEAAPKLNELLKSHPDIEDKTCFLFTYHTIIENKGTLRVALMHP